LYANRADAHRRLDEPDLALADYKTALKIDSNNPRGLLERGRIRARAGRHGLALIDFNRVISNGLDRPEAHYARALLLADLGDFEGAIADYDHVLSDPQGLAAYPDAYRDRAEAHCQIGQADAASVGWQVWLGATPGGAADVQEMLRARGYLRDAVADDFTPAALAALRAWTKAGCPGG
jgi:tetratricopeptide (TPR) repeat protein